MATLENPLNFIKAIDPRALKLPMKFLTRGLIPLGIFITGYSAAPGGYAEPTQRYEEGFVDDLRTHGKAAVEITSPTVTPGSVDAIGTLVAHKKNTDILYITAKDYLPYVDPHQLPATADKNRFISDPKYYFEDKNDYSLASAVASDVTQVTGGRDTAVRDFMNALQEDRTTILVNNPRLPTGFDTAKSRPNNAEEYLEKMIGAEIRGEELPYPAVNGFDADYMKAKLEKLKLVKVDDVDHPKYLAAPSIEILSRKSSSETGSAAGEPDREALLQKPGPGEPSV